MDSPRPYFTSFFRLTVVISLSGEGMALSFFLRESVQRRENAGICCYSIQTLKYTRLNLKRVNLIDKRFE